MKLFTGRAYNEFSLDESNSTLIKRSLNKKLADEICYLKQLPKELIHLFPKIHDTQINDTFSELQIEYLPTYLDLGKILIHQVDTTDWIKVASSIFTNLDCFAKLTKNLNQNAVDEMFILKTEREYYNLITKFETFSQLAQFNTLVINGREMCNFTHMWDKIKQVIQKLSTPQFTAIHGDCCFANILMDSRYDVKFIDPRGSFGSELGLFGDPRYDYAKLLHSISGGYEFFINDQFEIYHDGRVIDFKFREDIDITTIFNRYISERTILREVKLIEGLIFIGMCARHYDNEKRQLAMYSTGISILNSFL